MAVTVVDELYGRIRPLPAEQRLQLLARIAADLAAESTASPRPRRRIMEFYGVGRRSSDGGDAQDFINKLRDEWDERTW